MALLTNVQINSTNLQIKPKQPLIVKKLNQFYNNPMNQTCKMWSIFVDACTQFISEFFLKDAESFLDLSNSSDQRVQKIDSFKASSFDPLVDFYFSEVKFAEEQKKFKQGSKEHRRIQDYINSSYLNRTTTLLMSIQTSLAKAIYTANLRFFLDVLTIKITQYNRNRSDTNSDEELTNPIDEDMDEYLVSLMENDQKLPIFVYFARVLEQKFSYKEKKSNQKRIFTIEQIAVESGIKCVETFCQRYMVDQNSYSPDDYMLIPDNYEEYLKESRGIEFMICNKGED